MSQDIIIASFQCPNLQRAITKNNNFFLIFHQVIFSSSSTNCMTMFEAASCNNFQYIFITCTSFQCSNLQRTIAIFFQFSPGNLLIILYQLTKIEAPRYNNFLDIFIMFITSFQCPNLQRAMTQKTNKLFFIIFHQIIYTLSSIS